MKKAVDFQPFLFPISVILLFYKKNFVCLLENL